VLTLALVSAALAAGFTGGWSPCAFSMADTLRGAARATFALGAMAGGVLTYGGLALAGAAAGVAAPGVAALVAIAAAAAEARGARIVPQVRRQVPESWRRVLPEPVAGAAFGVLLGLGWTTFVLTYAVWALMAICVALGDPALGLAVGVAFGAGRAVSVVPVLAERAAWLPRVRRADAATLAVCALALVAAPAHAADILANDATDPSAAGPWLAWQAPGASGLLASSGGTRTLPGRDPVLAGERIAWRTGDTVTIAETATLEPLAEVAAPGATAIAFNGTDVVWRAPMPDGGEAIWGAGPRVLYPVPPGRQLGRPSLAGTRAVFHVAGINATRLASVDIASGITATIRTRPGAQLLHPTLEGETLVYVRSTATRQHLVLGQVADPATDAVIYKTLPTVRRDAGREPGRGRHKHFPSRRPPAQPPRPTAAYQDTLWTTALGPGVAYVTRLRARRGQRTTATLLRVPRVPIR
jgi:hypothetical protein